MIRVTIKDADALKSIKVDQLKTYLEKSGWFKRQDIMNTLASGERQIVAQLWSADVGPKVKTAIVVPIHNDFRDHVARMSEAIQSLEQAENRSQLEIYVDITQAPIIVRPTKTKSKKSSKTKNKN